MSYFLFGNYCCLDSLYSPPCIRGKRPPDKEACHMGTGNTRYVPAHCFGPWGSRLISPHTGYLLCAHVTSRALQHSRLPHPASEGTYPHGSQGIWWFRIERACVEFSNIRPHWGWHCGYRRLVFKLQLLLVLKDFKTLQRHLFQQKERNTTLKLIWKKSLQWDFCFRNFTIFLCAQDFENTSITETVTTV